MQVPTTRKGTIRIARRTATRQPMEAFGELDDSDDDSDDVVELFGRYAGVGADLLELFGATEAAQASAALRTEWVAPLAPGTDRDGAGRIDATNKHAPSPQSVTARLTELNISSSGLAITPSSESSAPSSPIAHGLSDIEGRATKSASGGAIEAEVDASEHNVRESEPESDNEDDDSWFSIIAALPGVKACHGGTDDDESDSDEDSWNSILFPRPVGGSLTDGRASQAERTHAERSRAPRSAPAAGGELPHSPRSRLTA